MKTCICVATFDKATYLK